MVATPGMKQGPSRALRRVLVPLALAQFICSLAGSNMNVMITDITKDLNITVTGVQAAITLSYLIMAVRMIPCSQLTDHRGRNSRLTRGMRLYGLIGLLDAGSSGH